VLADQPLFFQPERGRWSRFEDETIEYVPVSGALYRIPLRFFSDPHPRAAGVSTGLPNGISDVARSFAYELVTEFDPDNRLEQGPTDRIDAFISTSTPGVLALDDVESVDFDGLEIFVPDRFFDAPGLFDESLRAPDDPPVVELFEQMAARMRLDLGVSTLRVWAMTTNVFTTLDQGPPEPSGAIEDPTLGIRVSNMANQGRVSPLAEQTFTVRIQLETGGETVEWPPPSDSQAVALKPERD